MDNTRNLVDSIFRFAVCMGHNYDYLPFRHTRRPQPQLTVYHLIYLLDAEMVDEGCTGCTKVDAVVSQIFGCLLGIPLKEKHWSVPYH